MLSPGQHLLAQVWQSTALGLNLHLHDVGSVFLPAPPTLRTALSFASQGNQHMKQANKLLIAASSAGKQQATHPSLAASGDGPRQPAMTPQGEVDRERMDETHSCWWIWSVGGLATLFLDCAILCPAP